MSFENKENDNDSNDATNYVDEDSYKEVGNSHKSASI